MLQKATDRAGGFALHSYRRCRKRYASLRQATRIECRLFGRSTAEMFLLASGTRRRFLSVTAGHSMRSAIPMRNAAFKCPFRVSVRSSLRPGSVTSRPLHHGATLGRYAVDTCLRTCRANRSAQTFGLSMNTTVACGSRPDDIGYAHADRPSAFLRSRSGRTATFSTRPTQTALRHP